jgi:hypothetical protein
MSKKSKQKTLSSPTEPTSNEKPQKKVLSDDAASEESVNEESSNEESFRNLFEILIIDPKKSLTLALARDLRFMKQPYSHLEQVHSLQEGTTFLEKSPPHLVILSLNFTQRELAEFHHLYPASSRTFALIFTETPDKSMQEVRITPPKVIYSANLVAQHHASGYLLIGASTNQQLLECVERARAWVQQRFAREHKEQVLFSISEYLRHPLVVAQQKMLHTVVHEHTTPLYTALQETIEYSINKEKRSLPLDRLVRIEGDDKYCHLWYFTDSGNLESEYLPKKGLLENLSAAIMSVHKSHWVNVAYIRRLLPEELELLTDTIIPIARRERVRIEQTLAELAPELFLLPLLHTALQNPADKHRTILAEKRKGSGGGGKMPSEKAQ